MPPPPRPRRSTTLSFRTPYGQASSAGRRRSRGKSGSTASRSIRSPRGGSRPNASPTSTPRARPRPISSRSRCGASAAPKRSPTSSASWPPTGLRTSQGRRSQWTADSRGDFCEALARGALRARGAIPDDLTRILRERSPGETLALRVRRNGPERNLLIRTVRNPTNPRLPFLGIQLQEPKITLPLQVRFDLGQVGGPSAGLAFALDLFEELGRDVDHGLRVAATGEIHLDGSVRAVGG